MSEVLHTAVDEIERRLDTVGDRLVESYTTDILDYRGLDRNTLYGDVLPTAQRNVEELLTALREERAFTEATLDGLRRSAVRRVHQGVSLEALLHAYRVWGQVVWQEVLAVTDTNVAEGRECALEIAGRVMSYVDTVSVAVAQSYLDEVTGVLGDREAMRRDLLEALISGSPLNERMRQRLRTSALDVDGQYAVVLARSLQPLGDDRQSLRNARVGARRHLRPSSSPILVGIREDEVVTIYPVADNDEYSALVAEARQWAVELSGFAVGVGRPHQAADGIASSYAEAEEAVRLGSAGGHPHATTFTEVLLDHLVSSSPHLDTLHDETIGRLQAYDRTRNAQLALTLRVYHEHGFSLARSAAQLNVHPNTVVYRLRRIHKLTGYDPNDPDQLLLLLLGLKRALYVDGQAADGAGDW
ncbi:helix-turn-helix domain-containing protein [Saccharopolyspora sp. NPDC049357]|uniref:PucR family transcriptional regulator n=1 Tax=Saccharopolyspora sp. NPDC049357 TaxID=3154507 RepID=UPI003417B6C7